MLNLVRLWIFVSALLVGGGWLLSAIHKLDREGYVLLLFGAACLLGLWRRRTVSPAKESGAFRRWRWKFSKRFRRRPPQLYLLATALAFLGGSLYVPQNYDAMYYRLPRVMHWLSTGQWHWIHTFDIRLNVAACGMEWLSCPLILFSHSDRLLFLINWVSYLMLPALIFGVFTQLQVRPRVAWWWTWLLASGYCFVLQAGSIANDSFAAVYILAAVDLALRARRNGSFTDACLSLLAAALVTGAKQSNIPLVLLWGIAIWPARSLFWQRPWKTAAVTVLGLLVSIVPISLLNYQHCGTFLPLDGATFTKIGHFQVSPFWGIVGNAVSIPIQNLVPPFYCLLPPFYSGWPDLWNELMRHFLQTPFGGNFASFENFGHLSEQGLHGFTEGSAGLGFGLCLVIFATAYELRRRRKMAAGGDTPAQKIPFLRWLRIAPWGLLLVFMAKVGTFESARHLTPYYAFFFPVWLIQAGHSQIIRQRPWQRLARQVMWIPILLVIFNCQRPLFPAQTLFHALYAKYPKSAWLADFYDEYIFSGFSLANGRRHYFAHALPSNESAIGFYSNILLEDETSLWLPYGTRRVEVMLPNDPPQRLRSLGIHYVVVDAAALNRHEGGITRWVNDYDADIVGWYFFTDPYHQGPETPRLYLVRLN